MSCVCVLTPIVIGSWPTIAAAVTSVASAMGYSIVSATGSSGVQERQPGSRRIETEVPNSDVVEENLRAGEAIVVEKDGLRIEFGRNARGACSVCVSGEGYSKAQMEKIGQEVAGRVVQQFAYHKLMTELKKRNYHIVEEKVTEDQSIRVRVRSQG
jgi:hypothetical protein